MDRHAETARPHIPEPLGRSDAFLEFQQRLSRVAKVNRPVLLVGERGTGKELAANRLHFLSGRWQGPLVALNCAALSPSLMESELFGHEAGAFTGANQRRQGRFESASEGTLFLDEIGLIPMPVQEKILRVVEYGAFERVGGTASVEVDTRIIGATNADLPRLVRDGHFKADLLDRLSFDVLTLPPLRERHGDVMRLAHHFAERMALELRLSQAPAFAEDVMQRMERYDWPGNVRQLKNAVERAVYQCEGETITEMDFDPFGSSSRRDPADLPAAAPPESPAPADGFRLGNRTLPDAVRELELQALGQALAKARHHQGNAAKLLGLTYHQFRALYRKLREAL
ncbi:MAG: phage shock protein operon transcriptional activator [Verrucomicrobia bacterium]|nr:phage shock protein operon transcriptional activator [Verrucomicrobiota bacterium]